MPPQWGLEDWSALASEEPASLIVGNGLSVSVSSNFSYSSLYQEAGLSGPETAIFTALNTTNFELVLDYLRIAQIVCQHLHQGGGTVHQL